MSDVSGYALKNIGKEELVIAILKIAEGGVYFNPDSFSLASSGSHITLSSFIAQLHQLGFRMMISAFEHRLQSIFLKQAELGHMNRVYE